VKKHAHAHLIKTLKMGHQFGDMHVEKHAPPPFLSKNMLSMDQFATYNKLKVTTYGNVPKITTLWAPSHVSPPIMEIYGLD
jgi:hypothetical protein